MPTKTKKKSTTRKPKAKARAPISAKQQFIKRFETEFATTMRVLRAFPADQGDFKPHPRSLSARELCSRFVQEQSLLSRGLMIQLNIPAGSGGPPPLPQDINAIIEQYERENKALLALLKRTTDAGFAKTVTFFSGPGKTAEYPKLELAHFILGDQIHHRGQLSVYLRMTGGKVPSIYGPSGDEPWR